MPPIIRGIALTAALGAAAVAITAGVGFLWWQYAGGRQYACGQIWDVPWAGPGAKAIIAPEYCPEREQAKQFEMEGCMSNPCGPGGFRPECEKYGMRNKPVIVYDPNNPPIITMKLQEGGSGYSFPLSPNQTAQFAVSDVCGGVGAGQQIVVRSVRPDLLKLAKGTEHKAYSTIQIQSARDGTISFRPVVLKNPGDGKKWDLPINIYPTLTGEGVQVTVRVHGADINKITAAIRCPGASTSYTWQRTSCADWHFGSFSRFTEA